MMITSYLPHGFDGTIVEVETDIRRGIPGMDIVGLPDGAVREARDRVRIAIVNSGFDFPAERILINLSPAGLKKGGASFDLAIAASILGRTNQVDLPGHRVMIVGELQFSGKVLPVHGVVSAVSEGLRNGTEIFMVPFQNLNEACSLGAGEICGIGALEDIRAPKITEISNIPPSAERYDHSKDSYAEYENFSVLKGQPILKRAMEIAAAGKHHMLLFGPPGSGKTLSAHCFPSILPELTPDEALDVTRIFSLGGMLGTRSGLIYKPQFRAPHHSASAEGILGGGIGIKPGEISYAHKGVLFLDEVSEFQKRVLQALREPIETGNIYISRAGGSSCFPADFQLIMAVNPCPCGNLGLENARCICTEQELKHYWQKLSGPLLDRIDMRIPVQPIDTSRLFDEPAESSETIRERVSHCRELQADRYRDRNYSVNGKIPPSDLSEICMLFPEARTFFTDAVSKMHLSTRAVHSILKIARTIADLADERHIARSHILEALHYRRYADGDFVWNSRN